MKKIKIFLLPVTRFGLPEVFLCRHWIVVELLSKTGKTGDGSLSCEFAYDAYGNNISVTITENTDTTVKKTMSSSATYTTTCNFEYGNFALGSLVWIGKNSDPDIGYILAEYSYNAQNCLSALDNGNGDRVQYTYDSQGRLIRETYSGIFITVKFLEQSVEHFIR